jgi:hypothetical protein
MAVIDVLPHVEVTVVVDGQPLTEHIDTDLQEEDRTVTRYTEALSGKVFEVHVNVGGTCKLYGDALQCDIFVDGLKADTVLLQNRWPSHHYISSGKRLGRDKVKEYCFASLETGRLCRFFHQYHYLMNVSDRRQYAQERGNLHPRPMHHQSGSFPLQQN